MRTLYLLLLLSLSSVASADTFAVNQGLQNRLGSSRNSYLSKYDKNGDGFITDREFFSSSIARRSPAMAEKIFVSLDKNRDGVITEKEVAAKKTKKK